MLISIEDTSSKHIWVEKLEAISGYVMSKYDESSMEYKEEPHILINGRHDFDITIKKINYGITDSWQVLKKTISDILGACNRGAFTYTLTIS